MLHFFHVALDSCYILFFSFSIFFIQHYFGATISLFLCYAFLGLHFFIASFSTLFHVALFCFYVALFPRCTFSILYFVSCSTLFMYCTILWCVELLQVQYFWFAFFFCSTLSMLHFFSWCTLLMLHCFQSYSKDLYKHLRWRALQY